MTTFNSDKHQHKTVMPALESPYVTDLPFNHQPGDTHLSRKQTTDMGQADDPTDRLEQFLEVIRAAFAGRGITEQAAPMGGHDWTWSRRGTWSLKAGSILEPGVELIGPPGAWRCPPASLLAADLVLILLQLADAFPPQASPYAGAAYTAGAPGGVRCGPQVVEVPDAAMGPVLPEETVRRAVATGSADTGPCDTCPTLPDCAAAQRCARRTAAG